jgi:hypothetical protein
VSRNFSASRASVLIARRPHAVAFPQLPRLAARLASAKGFRFADLDALQDRIRPVIYRFEV